MRCAPGMKAWTHSSLKPGRWISENNDGKVPSLPHLEFGRPEPLYNGFHRFVEINARSLNAAGGESDREIQTFEDGAGAEPVIAPIRIAGWRLALIQRLSHARNRLCQRLVSIGGAVKRTDR